MKLWGGGSSVRDLDNNRSLFPSLRMFAILDKVSIETEDLTGYRVEKKKKEKSNLLQRTCHHDTNEEQQQASSGKVHSGFHFTSRALEVRGFGDAVTRRRRPHRVWPYTWTCPLERLCSARR